MKPTVRVFATPDELFDAAAALFVETARARVAADGRFSVALSGGTTPARWYARLSAPKGPGARVPWNETRFFWADERLVPPDHPASNFGAADAALLRHWPVDPAHVHRVRGELPSADAAAAAYEAEIRRAFAAPPGEWPRLDLVLLGLGADGHTASLFPAMPALDDTAHLAVATPPPRGAEHDRVTMTVPLLNSAASVVFLVEGAAKAEAVEAALEGPLRPASIPAQLVRPRRGNLVWLIDAAAARKLSGAVL